MTYFQTTTDARDIYRPGTAAEGGKLTTGTAVPGNLSDLMRNATIFRATFVAPITIHVNNPTPSTHVGDTYGPL